MPLETVAEPIIEDGDLTSIELRAVRNRELELRRTRGEISCAECRRLKLKCDRKVPCTACKRRGHGHICPTGVGVRVRRSRGQSRLDVAPEPAAPRLFTSTASRVSNSEWPATNTLRDKVAVLCTRVRELENALQNECTARQALERALHSRSPDGSNEELDGSEKAGAELYSRETSASGSQRRERHSSEGLFSPVHPLLAPELLGIKKDAEAHVPGRLRASSNEGSERKSTTKDEPEELMHAFGTLSVSDGRTTRFLGASATDQTLLLEASEDTEGSTSQIPAHHGTPASNDLPPGLAQAGSMWPFTPAYLTASALSGQLVLQLPPFERATALIEAYFINLSWLRCPVERSQFYSKLMPLFYPPGTSVSGGLAAVAAEHPHDLALLFALFACGAMADLTQGVNNAEGARYNALSRAALGLQSIFEVGSVSACQTIILLGLFEAHSGLGHTDSAWKMTSLALCLASSIGLHRDPKRWNLDDETVEIRRRVFWEIYLADLWRSLSTGRPSIFNPNVVDVEFPKDPRGPVNADGTQKYSIREWRFRFARDVLPHLSEKLCSAHPIKYSDILELDRKVRDFEMHPYHTKPIPQDILGVDADFFRLHPLFTAWYRELSLLHIHRNFFAKAMTDFPEDPLRSPLAPSVRAAYHSAACLLRIIRESHKNIAIILKRKWPVWVQALSCAVILATIAAKGRAVSFSIAAFQELEQSIALFEKLSYHPVISHSLPLVKRMHAKARAVLLSDRDTFQQHRNSDCNDSCNKKDDAVHRAHGETGGLDPDELLVLRGVAYISSGHAHREKKSERNPASTDIPSPDLPVNGRDSAQVFSSATSPTTASGTTGPSPVVVNSNLFQDMIMTEFGGGDLPRELLRGSAQHQEQSLQGLSSQLRPSTFDPSAWFGLSGSSIASASQSNAHQMPFPSGLSETAYFTHPTTFNFPTDSDYSFTASDMPAADVDTIMSYLLTLTPAVEAGCGAGSMGAAAGGAQSLEQAGFAMDSDAFGGSEWTTRIPSSSFTDVAGGTGDWQGYST